VSTGTAQSSSSSQKTYTITFIESGLPSSGDGYTWTVELSGASYTQYANTSEPGGNQITWTVYEPGIYYYSVGPTSCGVTFSWYECNYLPSVADGTVVVNDSNPNVVIPIQFYSPNMPTPTSAGTVTFNVSGLPSGFPWRINIGEGTQWYNLDGKGNQTVSIKLPSSYVYEYEFISAANCNSPSIHSGFVLLTDQEPNVTINIQCLQFIMHTGARIWDDIIAALIVFDAIIIPIALLKWHRSQQGGSGSGGPAAAQSRDYRRR